MISQRQPPRRRALKCIESVLGSKQWCLGSRLPTVRALSAMAGVSYGAVCGALAVLHSRKKIIVVPRVGAFFGTRPARRSVPKKKKWEAVRTALERDLLANAFRGAQIPPATELCRRYGVSFAVVRKALDDLLDDKVIVRHKTRFRINRPEPAPRYSSILFVGTSYRTGKLVMLNERFREVVRVMEQECAGAGVSFAQMGFLDNETGERLREVRRRDRHMGYLLWSLGPLRTMFDYFISLLAELNRPVAIIDEMGDYSLPGHLARSKLVKVFRIAGARAGMSAARHCIDLGHRRIAYLSPFHELGWSQWRLQGAAEAMKKAGIEEEPVACTFGNLNMTGVEAPVHLRRTLNEIRALANAIPRGPGTRLEPARAEILNGTEILEDTARMRRAYTPLFESMLSRRRITSLIICNDLTATMATDYLEERGVTIPRDLSVVSFDDSELAYQYGLTSYNFCFDRIAHTAFSFILQPHSRHYANTGPYIECEGMIMKRESTSRAPGVRSPAAG
jgi:DNA-binding LacI/PurR family transcriptional regulator